jgi:hypothetical protein
MSEEYRKYKGIPNPDEYKEETWFLATWGNSPKIRLIKVKGYNEVWVNVKTPSGNINGLLRQHGKNFRTPLEEDARKFLLEQATFALEKAKERARRIIDPRKEMIKRIEKMEVIK